IADGDAEATRGVDVDRIEADAVANEGLAVAEFLEAGLGDGGVVPDDDSVGPADLVVEVGVVGADEALDLSGVADDAALDGGVRLVLRGGAPVDDGNERHDSFLGYRKRRRLGGDAKRIRHDAGNDHRGGRMARITDGSRQYPPHK